MANNNGFYVAIPQNGNVAMVRFDKTTYDPRRMPQEQLHKATWMDVMPIAQAIEWGSSITMAGVNAMQAYGERVRTATLSRAVHEARSEPANPSELAKMAAFFEGIELDPRSPIADVQEALQRQEEAAAQQEEQERQSRLPMDDQGF